MKIAVDGPAGSGKSTVSKLIAKKLNINYLDTGAMYRMCTLKLLIMNIDFNDIEKVIKVIDNINIEIKFNKFFLDNEDVSLKIREREVANNVSKVATIGFVREKMVEIQRKISNKTNVIMDGRDIGTHVLPNSKNKFYLNASIEERATRRYNELTEKGDIVLIEDIQEDIRSRDLQDMNREISPLIKADDATEIDTTSLSIDEVVEVIISKLVKNV